MVLSDFVSHLWQRRLRFSVRGLIGVVLLIGGWLGWILLSAQIQREAVAAIERAGAWVEYDCEWQTGKSEPGGKHSTRGRFVDFVGVDLFGQVTEVRFTGRVTDAEMAHVARLTRLQRLYVFAFPFNSAWKTQGDVSELRVRDNQLTDAGVARLDGLTELSELWLCDANVSDVALAHLRGRSTMRRLYLCNTRITDAGLAQLKGMANLSVLWLDNTQITDDGLADLKGLSKLSNLRLYRTRVTEAGVTELKRATPGVTIYF
jgi:hypothetical protein